MSEPVPDDEVSPLVSVWTTVTVNAALETERRRLAHLLHDQIATPLHLLLSQIAVYEQTSGGHAHTQMMLSVLQTLVRQVLQQARDLEAQLAPTVLETLGLEPALETLVSQMIRTHGVSIQLILQRWRERLPPALELALFRLTQESLTNAVQQRHATTLTLQLERTADQLKFHLQDNGHPLLETALTLLQQYLDSIGGVLQMERSAYGGVALTVRFELFTPIPLTEREWEVMRGVVAGLGNKAIAHQLQLSPRTVKFHLDNIYSKLGVNTRTEAAVYVLRQGILKHP